MAQPDPRPPFGHDRCSSLILIGIVVSSCARKAPSPEECLAMAKRWHGLSERAVTAPIAIVDSIRAVTIECMTRPFHPTLVECMSSGIHPRQCERDDELRRDRNR